MSGFRYISVIVLLIFLVPLQVRAQPANAPWPCDRSDVNLYDYSASVVRQCGFTVYPLDHVHARPDGGKDFVYLENGYQIIQRVDPPSFDVTTATNQQLIDYGYPPRPASPTEMSRWKTQVLRMRRTTPPPFIIQGNISLASPCNPINLCWTGYVASKGAGTFTSSYVDYKEPGTAQSTCSNDEVAVWTGIGGADGGTLGQAGTLPHIGNGVADHQAFFETYPQQASFQLMTLVTNKGDDVQAHVYWRSGYWEYQVYDTTTGYSDDEFAVINSYTGGSTEAVVERPQAGSTIEPLRNFWTGVQFVAVQANNIGIQNFQPTNYTMKSAGGGTLATSSTLSGQSFNSTYVTCH